LQGDCLDVMADTAGRECGSDSVAICRMGTTQNKWDVVIPFAALWEQYNRIAKPNAAIVLTCTQPFTSALGASKPRELEVFLVHG